MNEKDLIEYQIGQMKTMMNSMEIMLKNMQYLSQKLDSTVAALNQFQNTLNYSILPSGVTPNATEAYPTYQEPNNSKESSLDANIIR